MKIQTNEKGLDQKYLRSSENERNWRFFGIFAKMPKMPKIPKNANFAGFLNSEEIFDPNLFYWTGFAL